MKRFWPLFLMVGGVLILIGGFFYLLVSGGVLPYQDPTPEQRASVAFHIPIAQGLMGCGVAVFVVGWVAGIWRFWPLLPMVGGCLLALGGFSVAETYAGRPDLADFVRLAQQATLWAWAGVLVCFLGVVAGVFWWLPRVAAAFLAMAGLLCIGWGVSVWVGTDPVPQRPMTAFESQRVVLAHEHVRAEAAVRNRLPTEDEFQGWIQLAHPDLRVEGQGFAYQPEADRFSFTWWDGDAWVVWRPEAGLGSVQIPPDYAFLFGSKRNDVTVWVGVGSFALLMALGVMKWLLSSRRARFMAGVE